MGNQFDSMNFRIFMQSMAACIIIGILVMGFGKCQPVANQITVEDCANACEKVKSYTAYTCECY